MRWYSFAYWLGTGWLSLWLFTHCSRYDLPDGNLAENGGSKDASSSPEEAATQDEPTSTEEPTSEGNPPETVLKWYTTCGDPVCRNYQPKQGIAVCTSQKEGDTCTQEGTQCDIKDNSCNQLLRCAEKDPKQQVGGCPISRRIFKQEIQYLSTDQKRFLYQQLMRTRLATYRYRQEKQAARKHLGWIIDDLPEHRAVDKTRDMIDLYAYTSMLLAALQEQDRQIKVLQRQVKTLQQHCPPRR